MASSVILLFAALFNNYRCGVSSDITHVTFFAN